MIEERYFWLTIVCLAAGTFAIRGSIIAVSHRVTITPKIRELFSFIPAAILPAIAAPMVFFHKGEVAWLEGKERAVVLLLAAAVCVYSRSMVLTVAFGLVALYFVRAIG